MKNTKYNLMFTPEDMFTLPEKKGDAFIMKESVIPSLKEKSSDGFSRVDFILGCQKLAAMCREKDCINLGITNEYVEHVTNAFISLKSDVTRQDLYKELNNAYGEELFIYGKPAQKMFESIYSACIENKIWELMENGPWSWPLFGLTCYILEPIMAFNMLERHWTYENGMKSNLSNLIKTRTKLREAIKVFDKYKSPESGEKMENLIALVTGQNSNSDAGMVVVSSATFSTESVIKMMDNIIYLGQHPEENCATNFNEVLEYMSVTQTYLATRGLTLKAPFVIGEDDCINYMKQALHYYTACYSVHKASNTIGEKYKDFYPENSDAFNHLIFKVVTALHNVTKNHNADVMRKREEAAKKAEEERKLKETEMQKEKEKIKARHIEYEKAGFKLFSENSTYEKWIKDNGNQSIDRFFIKASIPNDRLRFFQNLEELGLSNGKIRNVKSSAGVIRYIKLGNEEVGTDTLVEEAYGRIRKQKPPVTKRETIDITDSLLTLAADKLFFSLEDLEKAADRIKPTGVTLSDIRGLIKMMRDRGIIGQVKTKKKGAKVFALTAEGMVVARNRVDTKLPLIHIPWSDIVGEVVNDYVGKSDLLEVVTVPIKNIDAMIEGKSPKFLGKYYVTEF